MRKMKRCKSCGIECDEPTLGELLKELPKNGQGFAQVRLWIEKFGYENYDVICLDCFWK